MVQTSAHFNNLDILSKFIGKDYKTNTAQFDKDDSHFVQFYLACSDSFT